MINFAEITELSCAVLMALLFLYVGKNIKKSLLAFNPENLKLTPEDTAELESEIQ